jgi:PPOX class probable F420-dependent enzyme
VRRRSGSLRLEGDHAFIRSYERAWKTKRIRNRPEVELAPSTARGKPTGPAIRARARRLEGAEARHAARALARKHPLLHGVMVPCIHRWFRSKLGQTVHYELVPLDRD